MTSPFPGNSVPELTNMPGKPLALSFEVNRLMPWKQSGFPAHSGPILRIGAFFFSGNNSWSGALLFYRLSIY